MNLSQCLLGSLFTITRRPITCCHLVTMIPRMGLAATKLFRDQSAVTQVFKAQGDLKSVAITAELS